jgi:tartrate dehydrogenase/decarboxylase/D-malate dehydrogenase
MTVTHRIAAIPGDGIGTEVVPQAIRVLDRLAELGDFALAWEPFDWSCARFEREGAMMPPDGLEQLRAFDAIFLGAVGQPGVPDHVSLWGLLIPIRRTFDQYVNLRPIRLFDGVRSPLDRSRFADVDLVIVRENTEGEYSQIGGRMFTGTPEELAVQEAVFTRRGVERVIRYAFEVARTRRGHVTSATKSNGIVHTMPFWDEVFAQVAAEHPDVTSDQEHIDALSAKLVMAPSSFDVIVASNLFGDILSDLGAGVAGSIGIAPSANLNPEGAHPSMFEPVHGSAPDIAGRGIANPLGQLWSGAMMLDHLGYPASAAILVSAIEATLADGSALTADLGGDATTDQAIDAVLAHVEATANRIAP